MIHFAQPQWFWLLMLVPAVLIWRGRLGPVAAVEYSDVGLAREIARRSSSRIGRLKRLPVVIAGSGFRTGIHRTRPGTQ